MTVNGERIEGGNVREVSNGWDHLHYDHRSSKVTVAPWDLWKRLRDQCPAIHSDHYGGFWFVSRHEDVNRVLVDWETFTAAEGTNIPRQAMLMLPLECDPPLHRQYRTILNPQLAPQKVTLHEGWIRCRGPAPAGRAQGTGPVRPGERLRRAPRPDARHAGHRLRRGRPGEARGLDPRPVGGHSRRRGGDAGGHGVLRLPGLHVDGPGRGAAPRRPDLPPVHGHHRRAPAHVRRAAERAPAPHLRRPPHHGHRAVGRPRLAGRPPRGPRLACGPIPRCSAPRSTSSSATSARSPT